VNAESSTQQLFVDNIGDGEPILFVHGLGGTANCWRPLVNDLCDDYQLIVPDLPCSGRSPNTDDLSIESIAADMWDLLDSLDISRVRLIGHSMGTVVCQYMAAARPDDVISMVLLGPLAEPPEPARGALRDRAELVRQSGMRGVSDTIANVALSKKTKLENGNVQGFVRESLIGQDPEGYARSCIALANATAVDASTLSLPTCLITGDEDVVAPPANVEKLHQSLPTSENHILDNCGHWTLNERPNIVSELVRSFISNN
jgi:3-oxoadipate enol-lactonase